MDGIFGFEFPFNNLVDTTANPVSLKTNTVSIFMNKIINHIKIKAAHTDAAEIPNIKVKLKNLCLPLLHQSLHNNCKRCTTSDDLNSACCKIQAQQKKNDALDMII